jgi:hypothetical protein
MAKKIRVTNGRWWYCHLIGATYDVKRVEPFIDDDEPDHEFAGENIFFVHHPEESKISEFFVLKRDCEIVGEEAPAPNMVESPPHYNAGKFEVIDIIEDSLRDIPGGFEAYMVGNIEKYIMRYRHKNGVEDLKKSRWYLDRLIAEVEKSTK